MATWEGLVREALKVTGESFDSLTWAIDPGEVTREFDDGYGGTEGAYFTAWGENYVYFPVCYDGAEWVGYAPRNPCDIKTSHQGGG